MAFNTDASGRLTAFNGRESVSIRVDGVDYNLADKPVSLAFGPVSGDQTRYRVYVDRPCSLSIPMPLSASKATVKQGKTTVKGALSGGNLAIEITPELAGKWLDVSLK